GWDFLDVDVEIVRAVRKSIVEIFAAEGEAHFRDLEHRTLAAALNRERVVLALGGGALETAGNRNLLAKAPNTRLVYLEAPLDVLIARCENQQRVQPDAPRRPVLERRNELTTRFLDRQPLYESAHWTVHTAALDTDAIVRAIVTRTKENPASLRP
ncbi:MAG: shikimate kinase, partial [Acidobacteriaceae bacterium]